MGRAFPATRDPPRSAPPRCAQGEKIKRVLAGRAGSKMSQEKPLPHLMQVVESDPPTTGIPPTAR
ncbi:hypothetical protein GCM10017788_41520 [Amycolatopsis acidiphila]|nr:hypothetical protein GCM10017788_41520 [Amycolatopsis acidiphila]